MYWFAAMQQTSASKFPGFFQKFIKSVSTLRVNGTKRTSESAFIVHLFSLESQKESKYTQGTLFWGSR